MLFGVRSRHIMRGKRWCDTQVTSKDQLLATKVTHFTIYFASTWNIYNPYKNGHSLQYTSHVCGFAMHHVEITFLFWYSPFACDLQLPHRGKSRWYCLLCFIICIIFPVKFLDMVRWKDWCEHFLCLGQKIFFCVKYAFIIIKLTIMVQGR